MVGRISSSYGKSFSPVSAFRPAETAPRSIARTPESTYSAAANAEARPPTLCHAKMGTRWPIHVAHHTIDK
jgi:hypothetical protein